MLGVSGGGIVPKRRYGSDQADSGQCAKPKEEEEKENIKPKEEEIEKDEIKPNKKKKIIKKIVYQEASSSDSESADEVEIVKVKKNQSKKKETIEKPQPQQQNINNNSYSNLLYESSVDKLKSRMMDERAKMLIMSIMPNYG